MNDFSPDTRLILATIGSVIFGILGYNAGKKRTIGPIWGTLLGILGLIGFIIVCCFPRKTEPVEYEYYDYEPPLPSDEPLSAADEIEILKKQLDAGMITREEFNIRKGKIFGR